MMWARLGPCCPFASEPSVGPYGAIKGASKAPKTKIEMQTRPTIAGVLRNTRRKASRHRPRLARGAAGTTTAADWLVISAVPDPRVDEGVAEVDDQVHGQEDRREDEDQRLDHDVVVVLDQADHPRPNAIPAEDRLGQDRAAEQTTNLEPDHGRDRQPGVAHDVAGVDGPLREALGPGCADVILVAHVDDRCPGDPRDDRQRDRTEGYRRQDEMRQRIEHVAQPARQDRIDNREMGDRIHVQPGIALAQGGQPVELDPEDEAEGVTEDEDRDRDTEEGNDGHDAVLPAVRVASGEPAERNAQADGEDQRADGEFDGRGESDQERVRHASPIEDARTEIALQQPAEVGQVLDVQRLVEALGRVDLRDQLRRRMLPQDRLRRASGQKTEEHEQDHGQPEENRNSPQESADDEPKHRSVIPWKYRPPGILRPRGVMTWMVQPRSWGSPPSGLLPGDGYERDTVLKYSIALPAPTKPWTFEL